MNGDNDSYASMENIKTGNITYGSDFGFASADPSPEICFGSSFSASPSFLGKIAVDSIQLLDNETSRIADNCGYYSTNDEFSSNDEIAIKYESCLPFKAGVFPVTEMDVLCETKNLSVLLQYDGNYVVHEKACSSLRGTITSRLEQDQNLKKSISQFCSGKDQDGHVWLKTMHEHRALSLTDTCQALFSNLTVTTVYCLKTLGCSLCDIPVGMTIYRYGSSDIFDREFTVIVDGNNSMTLNGTTSRVERAYKNGWQMSSSIHDQVAYAINIVVPFGRADWKFNYKNETVTLSSCPNNEFCCNIGQCLTEENARCDGLVQCDDGSDESQCNVIEKASGYMPKQPPLTKKFFQKGVKKVFTILYQLAVHYVSPIYSNSGLITIDLDLALTWTDPRLSYWNLHGRHSVLNSDQLWIPDIIFSAGADASQSIKPIFIKDNFYLDSLMNMEPVQQLKDPYMGNHVKSLDFLRIN